MYTVCVYLYRILESYLSTSKTRLNAARAMKQITVDETVRGKVIADGGLKTCISLATNIKLEPEVRQYCSHAVAKILITVNCTVLSSHTRLDAIKPLLNMCNEDNYSYLEHFEALLSLTNLTSIGEDEVNTFTAQKGVKIVHFLTLSENLAVQRAAVEVLCNVASHPKTIEFFRKPEYIRLIFSLCTTWASDSDDETLLHTTSGAMSTESYKTSRAAAGMIVGMISSDSEMCILMIREKLLATVITLLGSMKVELIHRSFAILQISLDVGVDAIKKGGDVILGDHAANGVNPVTILEAAVSACMTTLKALKDVDANMNRMLVSLASSLLDTLHTLR